MDADKIIFAGPVGSGKTTAISCLSDIPIVSTDVDATDETKERKQTTTVAMDYGFFTLEDGSYIHLYGTPGQDRFDFMWEILSEGGLGLILLIDAVRPDPVADMEFYLDRFASFVEKTGAVIGITRTDLGNPQAYENLQDRLMERGQIIPMMELDARDGDQVRLLVQTLLAILQAEV